MTSSGRGREGVSLRGGNTGKGPGKGGGGGGSGGGGGLKDGRGAGIRTVPLRCRLMVQVVSHDRRRLVEQFGDLVLALAVESFRKQLRIVTTAGFDEDLLYRGALHET